LLIAFSTDLATGNFDEFAGASDGAFMLVDNIMLNVVPEPATLTLAGLGLFTAATLARRNRS
jgi:hypothetical protein